MERRVSRVPVFQIPRFANIAQIDASNYRDYVSRTSGTGLEAVASAVVNEQSANRQTLSDAVANLESQTGSNRTASPYESSIVRILSDARDVRANDIRKQVSALQSRLLIMPDTERIRGHNWFRSNVDEKQKLKQSISQLMSDAERFPSADELQKSYSGASGDFSRLISEYARLRPLQVAWDEKMNDGSGPADLPAAQMQKLMADLAEKRNKLQALDESSATELRKRAEQFNQEQDLGLVAASKMRIPVRLPLTGRFGNPQTGVGIRS